MSRVPGCGGWPLSRTTLAALAAAIAVVDQITKLIALNALGLYGREITVVPGFLWLEVIKNTGAAFGLFQSLGPLLAVITVVLIYAGYKVSRHEEDSGLLAALALILGGAFGNLIDRIIRGGVIDFLRLPNWPNFNIADCAITVGTAGILYYGFVRRRLSAPEPHVSDPG